MPTPRSLHEQAEEFATLSSLNKQEQPFTETLKRHGILLESLKQTEAKALEEIPEHLRGVPRIRDILNSSLGGEHFVSEEIDKLVESGMINSEEGEKIRAASMHFNQHEGERTNVMEPEQTFTFIDDLAGKSASEKEEIYKEISKEAKENPKAVYLDDQKLYSMLVISCGPEMARNYAEFMKTEKSRNRQIEQLKQESQKLKIELSSTPTSDSRYIDIRNRMEEIGEQSRFLHNQRKDSWKNFKAVHTFDKIAPKAFLDEQNQLADKWIKALKQQEAQTQLGSYAKTINSILGNSQLSQEQRDKQFQAELLKMLNYAKDTVGLPGKINIKNFDPDDIRSGYATGDSIYLNLDKMVVDGKPDFEEIFRVLFHESGHVVQHRMSSKQRKEIFGDTEGYYMESEISANLYALQPVEQHADYMGSKAKGITKAWSK